MTGWCLFSSCLKTLPSVCSFARAGVVVVLSQKQVSHVSHLSKKDSQHRGQVEQMGHIKSG